MITGQQIVDKAMECEGDAYKFAVEVNLDNPDPKAEDCSEMVEWDCHQLGVKPTMPDGAIYQMRHCRNHGLLITIEKAIKTPGALLFRISENGNHVAISRGDGTTIEARGRAYGVGSWLVNGRTWTHAGLIPGVEYRKEA